MKWQLAMIVGLRRWLKNVLAQSTSPEFAEKDSLFGFELHRLLSAFEFVPVKKVLLSVVDESGCLEGDDNFVMLFNEALATSGTDALRFPLGMTVCMDAVGIVEASAPSMPLLPTVAALSQKKTKLVGKDWSEHRVQFYEDDSFVCEKVIEFLLPAFGESCDGSVIVIAVPSHREMLEHKFLEQGVPVKCLEEEGKIVCLDAHETLCKIMANGMPPREV
jgi:hypothetical protein